MFFICVLMSIVVPTLTGTLCPPRQSIYPCRCQNVPQAKSAVSTSVACHHLRSTDSLTAIFPVLSSMSIDHFYLYDSFWDANKLGTSEGENKQILPTDWITLLRVKEMEIVDTTLSNSFACHSKVVCRNSITTRFTAVNSSSHEKISTVCGTDTSKTTFTWTGCMSKLQQFHFQSAKLTIVDITLFPSPMRELTEVDLSYNRISKIENNTFKNTPSLKVLDLSHNALQSLGTMFSTNKLTKLERLDVSWNLLKSLGPEVIPNLPALRSFKATNNYIVELNESHWQNKGNNLKAIDLTDNLLDCNCNIRWVNASFNKVTLKGKCATPDNYKGSGIRKISSTLIKLCDENGNIRRNTKGTTASPSSPFLKNLRL